jgi:23S rRNA (cytidine1920-2'-O)/16S rRNA (cytidine1409-2'-O)-methyltransferase
MPQSAGPKERLDVLLVARDLAPTRSKAQALILAGRVSSRGIRLDKAGIRYPTDIPLDLAEGRRYVGRGGHKLAGALAELRVDPTGRDTLDVGASTGGFTQVLLEASASRVIALDVGRGQLDWTLRNDPRVELLEGVNARYLQATDLAFLPSLTVVDVSFISLRLVLPALMACLETEGDIVSLVKPQFEVGRGLVGRGGIVRDAALHRQVLEDLVEFSEQQAWSVRGICPSRLRGAEGNREFFIHIKASDSASPETEISRQLTAALETDQ